jgi:hypothetical protein
VLLYVVKLLYNAEQINRDLNFNINKMQHFSLQQQMHTIRLKWQQYYKTQNLTIFGPYWPDITEHRIVSFSAVLLTYTKKDKQRLHTIVCSPTMGH